MQVLVHRLLAAVAVASSFALVPAIAQDKPAAKADAKPDIEMVFLKPTDKLPAKLTKLMAIDRAAGDTKSPLTKDGTAVLVNYTGWLYDPSKPDGKGDQFDSSIGRNTPFGFIIGVGRVIKGWDRGTQGMHEKGKRTLLIPAELAYGERERPKIPANSALIFDIEIHQILNAGGGAQQGSAPAAPAPSPIPNTTKVIMPTDPLPAEVSELHIINRTVGTGKTAESGTVIVHYTGWLYDAKAPEGKGAKFDSSVDRKEPFSFPLGGGRVIRGWDVGVAGMKEGGKRTLIIPPGMGYGSRGAGGVIPPNATLLFDVELLGVR